MRTEQILLALNIAREHSVKDGADATFISHANASIMLKALEKELGYSKEHITQQFKSELEISPADYLRRYRVAKSMELLCGTDMPVSDVAKECGFVDMSAFSRVFKTFGGETPSEFRKRCRRQ